MTKPDFASTFSPASAPSLPYPEPLSGRILGNASAPLRCRADFPSPHSSPGVCRVLVARSTQMKQTNTISEPEIHLHCSRASFYAPLSFRAAFPRTCRPRCCKLQIQFARSEYAGVCPVDRQQPPSVNSQALGAAGSVQDFRVSRSDLAVPGRYACRQGTPPLSTLNSFSPWSLSEPDGPCPLM